MWVERYSEETLAWDSAQFRPLRLRSKRHDNSCVAGPTASNSPKAIAKPNPAKNFRVVEIVLGANSFADLSLLPTSNLEKGQYCTVPYAAIDPLRLHVLPLSERRNLLHLTEETDKAMEAASPVESAVQEKIAHLAEKMLAARGRKAAIMLTYGAHLVKNGAGPLLNRLIEAGLATHLATQGAGIIHDWEFSFQGHSGESVRENAPLGTFGAWDETGRYLNLAVLAGAAEGLGFGESIGRMIAEDRIVLPSTEQLRQSIAADPAHPLAAAKADLLWTMETFGLPSGAMPVAHPFKVCSVPCCAYQHGVPFTVHPGIGYDIIVNHPMYHGGAIGRAAGRDARIFAASVDRLEGGVHVSIGSCHHESAGVREGIQRGQRHSGQGRPQTLEGHHLVIVDLQDGGGWDWSRGEPPSTNPAYYLRFCKSFYRMGGTLDYIRCDNRVFLVELLRFWASIW